MTSIKYKSAAIKTTPTDGSGRFTALLAAYGPPADWQNEILEFGAFRESIVESGSCVGFASRSCSITMRAARAARSAG